jgi:hypothetical protein
VADEYYSGEWMTPSFAKTSDVSEFVEKQMLKETKVTVKYDPRHPDRSVLEVDVATDRSNGANHVEHFVAKLLGYPDLPDDMNPEAQIQFLPRFIGSIDGRSQRKCESQTCPVSQGQTQRERSSDQVSCGLGVLGGKSHRLADRAEGSLPSISRVQPTLYQLALHFGQIYGAADGGAQKLRRQPLRA